jgi:putative ABC transport system ATP-binding protein
MTSSTQAVGQVPDEPDILCSDLVRIYSGDGVEVQALQGLNLRVLRGEIVALVGASGSGKSTLLGILSGLDRPSAGTAVVAGRNILTMNQRERVHYRQHSVGFVWQQTSRNLLPYLTAQDNVELAMLLAGTENRELHSRELLELLGIGHCLDRLPSQLSGGEQQRTAIAVALANSPRVLLADEPTGELDEATSIEVLEVLRQVNAELGITTLIVTHDATVSDHVRRTIEIRDGRTSTEVLRSGLGADSSAGESVAEEFTLIDSVGRLQLPKHYVTSLSLRDRVRLALREDRAEVSRGDDSAKEGDSND